MSVRKYSQSDFSSTAPVILIKQEANGPWLAHLSEIATADMQMFCNILPILLLQLMRGSSFCAVLGFEEENCIFFMPPPFSMGGHIVSPLSVRPSIPSVSLFHPSVPYATQMVSVRYLLKISVYWIEILYTGIQS